MDTASTDVFAIAEKRLSWIDQRQSVLAQNIANANTPGYAARDVTSFSDFLARSAQPTAGNGLVQSVSLTSPQTVTAAGTSIDGNSVALDEQLEKVAETDTAHQLATNLYKKYVSLFKVAIGRN